MADNSFTPDWVSPPGDSIRDFLAERQMSLREFARRLDTTTDDAKDLLSGRSPITTHIAQKLTSIFGGSEAFWIRREKRYRDDFLRLKCHLEEDGEAVWQWLSDLPLDDMVTFGWLTHRDQSLHTAVECLQFFGVQSLEAWKLKYTQVKRTIAFRTSQSFESAPPALAAWIRRGEIEASAVRVGSWNRDLFSDRLVEMRSLSRIKDRHRFVPHLREICADCGVAMAVVRAPTGCRASGATLFMAPSRPLLLLSLRYLSDDHFWFTFFHEAGHLLLHSHRRVFLEGESFVSSEEEEEANQFAENTLIPSEHKQRMRSLRADAREIMRFAKDIDVSPGIVVGQLQHFDVLKRNQMNHLKQWFSWDE